MRYWIYGVVIGVVVALVLTLILYFTAFKNKKMSWLYIILFLVFGAAGGVIQYYNFKVDQNKVPTPQDQIESITSTVEDNWKNSNGGFTFEQIQKSLEDEDCPSYNDQVISLNCYDFGGYVAFSFENNGTYHNALFYKSGNGLILDGMINTTATYDFCWGIFNFNIQTFKWKYELNKEPFYFEETAWYKCHYDNMVSVSRQKAYFVENLEGGFLTFNRGEASTHALKEAALLTGLNATSNFIKFGDVELIGKSSEGYVKINSFYNYLYEQINGQAYNTNKIIDTTNSMCVPIPAELQKKYPISADKKSDYNADYYGVYNCNIAVDLTFKQGNKTTDASTKNEEYVDTIKKDNNLKDKMTVEPLKPNFYFSSVVLNFTNERDSDLSNIDLSKSPVKVTFTCSQLNINKTVVIDNFLGLLFPRIVLLNNNQVWNYLIDSETLIFDTFKGHFSLSSQKTSLTFPYYYLDNYTIASVGLNAVGTVDMTNIDLSQNPVKIILANDDHTYQFVFDDNSKINSYQSMLVEMGKYNYTILSKQLEFASVTGSLTITSTDKIMLFNYAVTTYNTDLSFSINVEENTTAGELRLYSDSSNVSIIRDTLSSSKIYTVRLVIYDKDGKLMHSYLHTHSSTGNCGDKWNMNDLTDGETYTLQLRFADKDDSTKTYLSDVADFVYSSNKGFRVVYNTVKNK